MKKSVFNKFIFIFFVLAFLGFILFPSAFVFADSSADNYALDNLPGVDLKMGDIYCIFLRIMTWFFSFALVIAIIFLIINGLRYIFSSGDPQTLSTVHKNLSWISVGIVVVLLSTSVLIMIAMFLGVFTAGFEALILPIYAIKCEVVWWAEMIGEIFEILGGGI